jgi:hypothetical protein
MLSLVRKCDTLKYSRLRNNVSEVSRYTETERDCFSAPSTLPRLHISTVYLEPLQSRPRVESYFLKMYFNIIHHIHLDPKSSPFLSGVPKIILYT